MSLSYVRAQRKTYVPAMHNKFVGKEIRLYGVALDHALVLVQGDKDPA